MEERFAYPLLCIPWQRNLKGIRHLIDGISKMGKRVRLKQLKLEFCTCLRLDYIPSWLRIIRQFVGEKLNNS